MRWFVLFLLVANVGLYFWMQREEATLVAQSKSPPPDVGQLQLLNEAPAKVVAAAPPDSLEPAAEGPTEGRPSSGSAKAVPEARLQTSGLVSKEDAASRDASSPRVRDAQRATKATKPPPEPAAQTPRIAKAPKAGGEPEPAPITAPPEVAPASVVAEARRRRPTTAQSPATAKTAPATAAAAAPPSAAAAVCYRIGPLSDKAANTLRSDMSAGLELLSDKKEGRITSYYVMYPAAPTLEEALARLRDLRAAGYKDTLLLRKSHPNAISMGVFSRKATAESHAERVRSDGFDLVEVVPKYDKKAQRWLEVRKIDGQGSDDVPGLPKDVSAEKTACP